MAKAEATHSIASVTLTLTPEEAEFIRAILWTGIIGGNQLRSVNDSIEKALQDAGVAHTWRAKPGNRINVDELERV